MRLDQFHVITIPSHKKRLIIYDEESAANGINIYLYEMLPKIYAEWQKDPSIVSEIPYEEWTTKELVMVSAECLQYYRKNVLTGQPEQIRILMQKAGISEGKIREFFQLYTKDLFSEFE